MSGLPNAPLAPCSARSEFGLGLSRPEEERGLAYMSSICCRLSSHPAALTHPPCHRVSSELQRTLERLLPCCTWTGTTWMNGDTALATMDPTIGCHGPHYWLPWTPLPTLTAWSRRGRSRPCSPSAPCPPCSGPRPHSWG